MYLSAMYWQNEGNDLIATSCEPFIPNEIFAKMARTTCLRNGAEDMFRNAVFAKQRAPYVRK